MPQPSRGRRRRGTGLAGVALLPLLLAGCSGSRFGEALSRSFSSGETSTNSAGSAALVGPAPGTAPPPAASTGVGGASPGASGATNATPSAAARTTAASGANAPGGKTGRSQAGPTAATTATVSRPAGGTNAMPAAAGFNAEPAARVAAPTRPAPYRVTILLPQADAAAPAEVVTQALRAAGVPFEVETIERLGRDSTPQAPVSRPAPAPR